MPRRLPAAYSRTWFRSGPRRAKRFGIVTAHDAFGRRASPAENRRRDALLRRVLKALGLKHWRVTGGSEDGSHREPGWGIAAKSPARVRALAALFDQLAFFWIDGDRVLLGATKGGALKKTGAWSLRRARWR